MPMMKTARPFAEQLGVELVDVRITKIDLPQQVQDSVFERMRATFKAQAAKLRAEGVEASDRIRAEANKEQTGNSRRCGTAGEPDPRSGRCVGERGLRQVVLEERGVLQLLPQHAVVSGRDRHARRFVGDSARQCLLQVLQQTPTAASEARARTWRWTLVGPNWRAIWAAPSLCTWCSRAYCRSSIRAPRSGSWRSWRRPSPTQLRWGGLISMVVGLALLVDGAQWVRIWS